MQKTNLIFHKQQILGPGPVDLCFNFSFSSVYISSEIAVSISSASFFKANFQMQRLDYYLFFKIMKNWTNFELICANLIVRRIEKQQQ